MSDEKLFCDPNEDQIKLARELWTQRVEDEQRRARERVESALSSIDTGDLRLSDVLLALQTMAPAEYSDADGKSSRSGD